MAKTERMPHLWGEVNLHLFLSGRLFLFLALFLSTFNNSARGDTGQYELEAASLGNFPEYTDWPPNTFTNATAPVIIGVLGKNPFGKILDDAVRDKKAHNHPLVVRQIRRINEATNCQVLFISDSETNHLPKILAKLRDRSILTVSDMPDFTMRGGMVGLMTTNNQVQFRVNLDTLKAARLNMSSQLLRAADIVISTNK